MNRLVIIGNGFDLAHGLPTSYRDFIDDYWKSACKTKLNRKIEFDNDNFVKLSCELGSMYSDLDYESFHNIASYKELMNLVERNKEKGYYEVKFKNSFFKIICDNSIENWVDIENEYYKKLKKIVKSASLSNNEKKEQTIILNKEFEQVKNLLEDYLAKKVNVKSAFENDISNVDKILSFFKIQFRYISTSLSVESKEAVAYTKEFNNEDLDELESFDFKIIEASKKGSLYDDLKSGIIEQNNLFLNFNYTNTINNYVKLLNSGEYCGKVEEIQIHGTLYEYENKINFGFGDEMDDDYKQIENLNDNEYLKNFKSFGYTQNSNYRKLLDFIYSEKFQVFIMGHSCGLSDRTLLNTIFEHENCRSIKVFYHEEKDEKGKTIRDNFTELIQNISRHLNDKKMMRSKIVNKISCEALPQKQTKKS